MLSAILSFDQVVEQFLYIHRTPLLTEFFSWITLLGDARVITVLGISMAIVLLRHHRSDYVAGLATTIFGSVGFSYALKLLVARGRPMPSLAAIDVPGYSFPSMHAASAIAMYGFIGLMIWKLLRPSHHRMPALSVVALLIILIGFSRLYLGVHYPSDVIAGYVIGGVFVWLGHEVSIWLERRTTNAVWRLRPAHSRKGR